MNRIEQGCVTLAGKPDLSKMLRLEIPVVRLFNTLTQREEEFEPIEDRHVRMYTCGPTVYHFAHIGNLRTFMFQDILRRYLLYRGYRLTHVMNITDVDDKIIAGAKREGLSLREFTRTYIDAFLEDLETLRIQRPEVMPRATEHIPEMLALIKELQKKGLTYERGGSTYFRIDRFPEYGKLSGVQLDNTTDTEGALDEDQYTKENPRDFALWKGKKAGEASWESDLGEGRPGWHIECSAMSMRYLGPSFDIHCGGVDLVFPHHENEIAQSEGATGVPFVKYWVHGSHLIVEGEKMSKSLGNQFTLGELLEKGYSPVAIRYLLLSVHYRKQLNFTFKGLDQARASLQRVDDFLRRVREIGREGTSSADWSERVRQARREFELGMDSDLNTSAALAAVFELVRDLNIALDQGEIGFDDRKTILDFFREANKVFAVFQVDEETLEDDEVLRLLEERTEARRHRDYKRADAIRRELESKGFVLEDTKEGTRWKRLN